MKNSLKTHLGFALACLVILFATVSASYTISTFVKDSRWLVHTASVLGQIEKLQAQLTIAQNNIRAYLLSEESYYNELHQAAKTEVYKTLEELRQSTADNEVHRESLRRLSQLIDEKAEKWETSFVRARKEGRRNFLRDGLRNSENKAQDEEIAAIILAMKDEENRLYEDRIEAAVRQGHQSIGTSWIAGILACLLIVVASFIVYRDNRKRQLAEDNIERYFDLSLDLLCISGMDGYFKKLSPSFTETLGYSLKELYSKPVTDFVHPDDVQRTADEIARQAKGNRVLSFENRFRCKDGSYKVFSWKSVPEGQFMYAVARDVTQQKMFEAELMTAREAALDATAKKTAFLAHMSHEIRTPLNGVVGLADLLARTNLEPQQKTYVSSIQSSASILLKTINEVLDFSKIEAKRIRLEKIDFDLSHLIQARISLVGPQAHSKGLKLEALIDPQIPKILSGDAGKIGQIILNILNNSVKFTKSGRVTIEARTESIRSQQCEIRINIRDTGIGIDADEIPHLFEPYTQGDSSTARKYGGTGLGLSICKSFVELMGGTIGVESDPGKGSNFWFTLPLEISTLNKVTAVIPENPELPTPEVLERRKKVNVLIAEDNHSNQMIVMQMMKLLGYTATLAENGEKALECYKKQPFDLILMDQHMPVMDGVEAARKIRAMEAVSGKKTPIVAFTATVAQNDERTEFDHLMDGTILKPVTLDSLEKILDELTR